MLSFVEVENFRLFEHYRLAGLSRVNLLVGENNCGKSFLLEAAHFLASRGPASSPGLCWQPRGDRGIE